MKTILVIHTGGTIAMQKNQQTGGVSLSAANPLSAWDHSLPEGIDVITEHFLGIPSPHMTPAHMVELYHFLSKRMRETNADGAVITHGTDTLEETAFVLDLLHADRDAPIVITGAMRSSNELISDGPHNFISALRTALSDASRGRGVLAVMNDEIHEAREVTKTHTTNLAAFSSPNSGPVGAIQNNSVIFHHPPHQTKSLFTVTRLNKTVPLLKTYSGMDPAILQYFLSQPIDGIVLEAMGAGNLPPALTNDIRAFIERDIPVTLASRCPSGAVQPIYSYEGGGKYLEDLGVILCGSFNGVKARLIIMAALESGAATDEIQYIMRDF